MERNWEVHARWAEFAWWAVTVLLILAWTGTTLRGGGGIAGPSAVLAGLRALITLYIAIRLTIAPTQGALLGATIWAGLNIALGVWALASEPSVLPIPFIVLVGGAGIESWQAWQGRRA
jgi:apolipoprotein N-acyltransferase